MKPLLSTLFIAIVLSASAFSFEGGGVDVGNSNQKGKFSLPEFSSETEMVHYLEGLLPKIEKGETPEVRRLLRRGRCGQSKVTFSELAVNPSYRYNRQTRKLEKEFSGEVSVILENCRRPGRL
jgi:hypothetical protein